MTTFSKEAVSKEAIRAAIQELSFAAGVDDLLHIVCDYFNKFGVDIETWLPVFNEFEEQNMPKQGTQQVDTGDDNEIFVDDSDFFVDDAWVAEQEEVHARYQREMNELRERIFSTPPEKFLKILPFSKRHLVRTAKSGRQSGARKPARPAQKKASSGDSGDSDGDGDGGDGEPPRPRLRSLQQEQQPPLPRFYTYAQFAEIFGITPESLRNSVSAGRFPKPIQTIFGPRFSDEHLAYALTARNRAVTPRPQKRPAPPPAASPRPRGRPRIAAQMSSKGGAA